MNAANLLKMKKLLFSLAIVSFVLLSCEKKDNEKSFFTEPDYEYINHLQVSGNDLWVLSSKPVDYYSIIAIIPPYYLSRINLIDGEILQHKEIPSTESFTLNYDNQPYLGTFNKKILKVNPDFSTKEILTISKGHRIQDLILNKNNDVWIATDDGGLYLFNGKDTTRFCTSNSILASNWIPSMTLDKESNIWFVQGMDLFKIDANNLLTKDPDQLAIDKSTGIFNLSSDRSNILFGSKWDGNYHRLLKKEINKPWTTIDPPKSSNRRPVKFIRSDSNGTIWICYSEHPKDVLAYYDTDKWVELYIPMDEVNIIDIETYKNKIILGTSKGIFTVIK
jgi:hypothetical protein